MSEELRQQVEKAASADQLACGHRGKCKTCPTCKRWNEDDIPEVHINAEIIADDHDITLQETIELHSAQQVWNKDSTCCTNQ